MIVEPLVDEIEWEKFVADSPDGTFFHTIKWKNVLENSFPYQSSYLCIRDSSGQLVGVCPFFITKKLWPFTVLDSLPDSDLGGPLLKEEYKKDAAKALVNYLIELGASNGIAYTKMRLSDLEACEYLRTNDSNVDDNSGTMILDLDEKPLDIIWEKVFTKKGGQRRLIRRFERDGFQIREAKCSEDLNNFYKLYCEHKYHLGASPYPFKYFEIIWSFLHPDNFNIILVEKDDECIGASAFFIYKEQRSIYLCYIGYNKGLLSTRYNYSYYARWKEIEWAHENGFRYVSFGPSPKDPNSVYHSRKISFGCDFIQDHYLYIPHNKKLFLLRYSAINLGRKAKYILPSRIYNEFGRRLL